MNKYILADMATEKLIREIGMVAKPLPEEIRTLKRDLPTGTVRHESALYQAEKLKKITIGKRSNGRGGAGTVVMLISADEYELPFVLVDLAFDFFREGTISAGFHLRPIVEDAESKRKYIDPFFGWHETISKLPGEPVVLDLGPFMKANPPPLKYACSLAKNHVDEVLEYTEQFLEIFLDIYRKAQPVQDPRRRRQMEEFRSGYNRRIFGDDYSGKVLIENFGPQIAALFYEYLVYL